MSTIHFIGGEKGGVGKSVMSRALSQYMLDNNLLYAGFDADQSHNTLARFYPEFTQAINIDNYEGADQIVEKAVEEDVSIVVDLPAQSERFLNKWMDDNDVASLCEEMNVNCVYWYVVDDGIDSAGLAAKFLKRFSGRLPTVLVKNLGRGEDFSALDNALIREGVATNYQLELPALHTPTMRHIDSLNMSFWGAGNITDGEEHLSLMERQRSRVWLNKVYAQIRNVVIA